jgi:hypothetical protein
MRFDFHTALTVACLTLPLAGGAAALDLVPGDKCLKRLSERTREWSECVEHFGRSDDRCSLAKAKMASRMEICERKGYKKAEIDKAMTKGYQSAGRPRE